MAHFRAGESRHPTSPASLLQLACIVVALVLARPVCAWADAPRRIAIGNGSGHLNYPDAQKTLGLQPGDTLYINPGTYSGLSLGNLSGSAASSITVLCDAKALFTTATPQPNELPNIAHLRFENFRYETYNSTCMRITGASHDLLFKDFIIKDASGYSFHIYDAAKDFDGTKASTFYNFKWENMLVDGKTNGPAICNANYSLANMKSVLLDFEVYRCTFKHFDNTAQAFAVMSFERCFNLEVHECDFSDIGMAQSPIGHDVCIGIAGYAKVHGNKFTRQWANDVRVWPMKLNALGYDGKDAINRFYNNISWEKRKYPMYEHNHVRQADIDKSAGQLSRTGSEIYFNTLYRSRRAADSKDPYVGHLVDVYGPDVTIKHNLVIEPEVDTPFDPARNYVYHLGAGAQTGLTIDNNLVFETWAEAGLEDDKRFIPKKNSPALDAATGRVGFIATDHNNNGRYEGAAADLGAVERQIGTK